MNTDGTIRIAGILSVCIHIHPWFHILLPPRGNDGQGDGDGQNRRHDEQREAGRDFDLKPLRRVVVRIKQHFHADEHQHDGQAGFQMPEISDRAGQHENTASAGRGWQRRSR